MPVDLDPIRRALAARPPLPIPPRTDPREADRIDAGVLVPLHLEGEPSLTMTVRGRSLEHHAGEVCFPGGKPTAEDADLLATALREAREEIGLEGVELLGALSPMPAATSQFRLHPFVGLAPRPAARAPSSEVARVLDLPLRALLDGTYGFRAVPFFWGGVEILSPFWVLDDETRVYGVSSYILLELVGALARVFGWTLPAPVVVDEAPWPTR